jgi:hypothetical protein
MEDPTTHELRAEQERREAAEREAAAQSDAHAETETHDRRAMKAEYLRAKLEERAQSERAVDDGGD